MSEPAYTNTCPACGKRILPSDTLCWHCGHKLPEQAAPLDLPLSPRVVAKRPAAPQTDTPSYDLRAIAVYGSLTLAVFVALLLVMGGLGRRPLLVNSAGLDIPDDWIQLTDSQLRYTLAVPGGWQWLDVPFRDQQGVLAELTRRQPYIARSLNPLGQTASDLSIESVALVSEALASEPLGSEALGLPDPVPFVVIAASPRLRELTPQEALSRLADSPLPVSDQRLDDSVPRQPRGRFSVRDAPAGYQCQHLVTADPATAAYLVAACAPEAQYAGLQAVLDAVLNSFQLLEQ
jgi:hypothetical protein